MDHSAPGQNRAMDGWKEGRKLINIITYITHTYIHTHMHT